MPAALWSRVHRKCDIFHGSVNDSGTALRLLFTRIALLNAGLHVIMTIDS